MKTFLALTTILVTATALAAANDPPARVFIVHPKLVTDISKSADFMDGYLRRWAKSEITIVDAAEGADLTVEILHSDTQVGAGTARTSRGVFGGVETHKDNVYTTTAKVCLTRPTEECTELTKESQNLPSAVKKFVKDNAKALSAGR